MKQIIALLMAVCICTGPALGATWPFRDDVTQDKTVNVIYALGSLAMAGAAFQEDTRTGNATGATALYFTGKHLYRAVYGQSEPQGAVYARTRDPYHLATYRVCSYDSGYGPDVIGGLLNLGIAAWGFSERRAFGTTMGVIFTLRAALKFGGVR